ncbi:hypothetical protein [Streptomyces spiralis]|uniref:hypothetical protein n=1 Tax=Streptomyces spiralis TaxID=66376 RepID=UPI0036AD5309
MGDRVVGRPRGRDRGALAAVPHGPRPVCLSTQKLYGTWSDPEPARQELPAMVQERSDRHVSVQTAAGHRAPGTGSSGYAAAASAGSRSTCCRRS